MCGIAAARGRMRRGQGRAANFRACTAATRLRGFHTVSKTRVVSLARGHISRRDTQACARAQQHLQMLRQLRHLLLAAVSVRQIDACCKSAFIAKFNLTHTALATNYFAGDGITNKTMLTVEDARRKHIHAALHFVPSLLMDNPNALRLEFGVRNAVMMKFMSAHDHRANDQAAQSMLRWDGFDSFQGLPKSTLNAARLGWGGGKYSVRGNLPAVPANVRLHVGWFNESLPPFLDSPEGLGPVAFAHLDADIYTSTISVLTALAMRCRLRIGTVLAFDEIFGPPRIQFEELRALEEATASYGLRWRFITYLNHPRTHFGRAAVQITEDPPCVADGAYPRATKGGTGTGSGRRVGRRRPLRDEDTPSFV